MSAVEAPNLQIEDASDRPRGFLAAISGLGAVFDDNININKYRYWGAESIEHSIVFLGCAPMCWFDLV
jgi:hypothetical protein